MLRLILKWLLIFALITLWLTKLPATMLLTTWLGILIPLICIIHYLCYFHKDQLALKVSRTFFVVLLITSGIAYGVFLKYYLLKPYFSPLTIANYHFSMGELLFGIIDFPGDFIDVLDHGFNSYSQFATMFALFLPVILSLVYMFKLRKPCKFLYTIGLAFTLSFTLLVILFYALSF